MLQNSIHLNDGMSPILQKIIGNMERMMSVMQSIDNQLGNLHSEQFNKMAADIANVQTTIDLFDSSLPSIQSNINGLDESQIKSIKETMASASTELNRFSSGLTITKCAIDNTFNAVPATLEAGISDASTALNSLSSNIDVANSKLNSVEGSALNSIGEPLINASHSLDSFNRGLTSTKSALDTTFNNTVSNTVKDSIENADMTLNSLNTNLDVTKSKINSSFGGNSIKTVQNSISNADKALISFYSNLKQDHINKAFNPFTITGIKKAINVTNSEMRVFNSNLKVTQNSIDDAFNNRPIEQVERNIKNANSALNSFNEDIPPIKNEADKVTQGFSKWQSAIVVANQALELMKKIASTISKTFEASDTYVSTLSRLNMMNDGLQTTAELNKKIFESANKARASYNDTADSVAKLGNLASDAFGSTDEIIAFSEALNKAFVVSGASASEQSSAMLQLTQAMASGVLQGDEYRSIIENAPMVAQAIADYLGVTRGELKELSSQGVITSDVVKNAMLGAADDINSKFESMPMTFGQQMTLIKNQVLERMGEVYQMMNNWVNSSKGSEVFDSISETVLTAIDTLKGFLPQIMTVASNIALVLADIVTVIMNVIDTVQPLISIILFAFDGLATGLSFALDLINGALTFIQDNTWLLIAVLSILAAAILTTVVPAFVSAISTMAIYVAQMLYMITVKALMITMQIISALAQQGLNAALAACPISWLIAGLIAVVAALIYFSDAAGVVGGMIFAVVAYIAKWVLWLATPFVMIAEFFANVFRDPAEAVKMLFINAFNAVIEGVALMATGIDFVINKFASFFKWLGFDFGIESNIADAVREFKIDIETSDEYISYMDELQEFQDSIDLDEAFDSGFDAFKSGAEAIKDSMQDLLNFGDSYESVADDFSYDAGYSDIIDGLGGIDDIGSVGSVGSVGKIDSDVSISDEDLKYLRDIAEIEFVNKYTTSEVQVNANFGDVHETADTQKITNALAEAVKESLAVNLV